MDLEHLTKHQIVLLTLLVSFVTSIATGIVTVSLMDQAPPGVTRVVNQIVEHTVEKVVPASQGAATATVTEKTVVVKDDDLAAQSIAQVQKGIIRITAKGANTLLARGILLNTSGVAITDRAALAASGVRQFDAILVSGERVAITIDPSEGNSTLVTGMVAIGTSTGFAPVTFVDPAKLALGQSVIRIDGVGSDTVGSGVIAMLPSSSSGNTAHTVQASVGAVMPGAVLMTLFGEVIGIVTSQSLTAGGNEYSAPISTAPEV
ncbi:hypothetical protein H7X87_02830 [Acetobacteraceae bacterium]|nr:hypothetical protein [Candidatus Parcubacteria bacterium]